MYLALNYLQLNMHSELQDWNITHETTPDT